MTTAKFGDKVAVALTKGVDTFGNSLVGQYRPGDVTSVVPASPTTPLVGSTISGRVVPDPSDVGVDDFFQGFTPAAATKVSGQLPTGAPGTWSPLSLIF